MRAVIIGLPKSGTTLLFSRLRAAMTRHLRTPLAAAFEPSERITCVDGSTRLRRRDGEEVTEAPCTLVKALLRTQRSARGWSPEQVRAAFAAYERKLLIVRDPRDRWISAFFYHWYKGNPSDTTGFLEALQRVRQKERDPANVSFLNAYGVADEPSAEALADRIRTTGDVAIRLADEGADEGWRVVRYEDVVDGRVESLERWFGFELGERNFPSPELARVARTRRHGDWRRWLTPADVAFLRPLMTPFLDRFGYDVDDWELRPVDRIDPREGSAYMSGLHRGRRRPSEIVMSMHIRLRRIIRRARRRARWLP
jgi:hypothetical protein